MYHQKHQPCCLGVAWAWHYDMVVLTR